MASIPYMPLYVADYLSDTAHLTHEEMGMYSRLIALYWQRGSAIPADDKRLCTMLGIPYERSTDVVRTIKDFFIESDGLLYHKRIESELAKFREKSDKAKAAVNTRYKAKTTTDVHTNVPTDVVRTNYHTDTDTDTKKKNSKTSKAPAKADASEGRELVATETGNDLYHSIQSAFLAKNGNQFSNYPKEAQATKGIIAKCKARDPDNVSGLAQAMIEKLWQLKSSGRDKFYTSQPFLPSTLNASGIWDRVLEQYRDNSEQDAEAQRLVDMMYGVAK